MPVITVVKRDNRVENCSFDKISNRLEKLCQIEPSINVNVSIVSQKTIQGVINGISTTEIDVLSAEDCANMAVNHPDYSILAGRICVSNLHKSLKVLGFDTFSKCFLGLAHAIRDDALDFVRQHRHELDEMIVDSRDYLYDYFGFKTVEKIYLCRTKDNKILETPQYMHMRVAICLSRNLEEIKATYEALSKQWYTHATPTIFNACMKRQGLASCFLLTIDDDLENIYDIVKECALISKSGGGIGIDISRVRATGSYITGTNTISNGIIPMIRMINNSARYVTQGKRAASIALYLEPWHADIIEFLDCKKNTGAEEVRARDLFYGVWLNNLFMERVSADETWSLMCPSACPGLTEVYGTEFNKLYLEYESQGKYVKQVNARNIFNAITTSMIETGGPYMVNKDEVNEKSNQKNIGIVRSSNLCVSGDTRILTDTGYHNIMSIVDQDVNVWNGNEFSKTTVRKTGINDDILLVKLSNGMSLRCTYNHGFYVEGNNEAVEAKNLALDTRLIKFNLPLIIDGDVLEEPYTHSVPINYCLDSKLRWLESICDSNGYLVDSVNIEISSTNEQFLLDIQLLLQTLGCISHLSSMKLYINGYNVNKLRDLGFEPDQFNLKGLLYPSKDESDWVTITSIEDDGKSDNYCFTEPLRNMGIFNGILTSQCCEITEVASEEETAVCNLASINLRLCITSRKYFDYNHLGNITRQVTRNLNKVIDNSDYPGMKATKSNNSHRPIGTCVQGLHDVFMLLRLPFESKEASELNTKIFQCIYYNCLLESNRLAIEDGTYHSFHGSPFSQGLLQFDLWKVTPEQYNDSGLPSLSDWQSLKDNIVKYGTRNSLLTAIAPTATTAQILGNVESVECITNNMYTRRTASGEFQVVNRYLLDDLIKLGIWNNKTKNEIMKNYGSIQSINGIPDDIKSLYKTVWEITQKTVLDHAVNRGPYIDQSQSTNLFINGTSKLTSAIFYAWSKKLKTLNYYIRTKPIANPIQFTVEAQADTCRRDNPDCSSCSA